MVDIYLVAEPRSPKPNHKKFAYRIQAGSQIREGGCKSFFASWHKAQLHALISALSRFTRPTSICIYTEDAYIISGLEQLKGWHDNGYCKANGEEIKNRAEWERVYPLICRHTVSTHCGRHAYTDRLMEAVNVL